MNRLVQRLFIIAGLALAASGFSAGTTPPPADAKPHLSPRLKSALTPTLPAWRPPEPAADQGTFIFTQKVNTDPDVITLPALVVRENKWNNSFLTRKGMEEQYMDKYLGSKHGLDRGFLNRWTLSLGAGIARFSFFGAVSNADRAREAHYDDWRLRSRADLLNLTNAVKQSGDAGFARWIRSQSNHLFVRPPDILKK